MKILYRQTFLSFDDNSCTLTAADTQRGESDFFIGSDHFMEQGYQNTVTGSSDRMAQCNCTAVYVGALQQLVAINAVLLHQLMDNTQ